jgi:tRNA pseudouridine55 synthase
MQVVSPPAVDGVLLIDKPVGPSSNAVLQHVKRVLGAARAGHTGTLDPLASGLLIVGLGEATKFCGDLLDADKAYLAKLKLGVRTATGDAEGPVLARSEVAVTRDRLIEVLSRFRGEIEQLPPMYAAIKHQGRPLYSYARSGTTVQRTPRRVVIRYLELEEYSEETVVLRVNCSKGTYVRVLAEDLGEALGCGAHLAALRRLLVGGFTLDQAIGLEALELFSTPERLARLLPPEALVSSRPRLDLHGEASARFRQGGAVPVGGPSRCVAVFGEGGAFIGTGQVDLEGTLHAKRLLALR